LYKYNNIYYYYHRKITTTTDYKSFISTI